MVKNRVPKSVLPVCRTFLLRLKAISLCVKRALWAKVIRIFYFVYPFLMLGVSQYGQFGKTIRSKIEWHFAMR